MFNNQTITLTWGCQAENHVNMQKVGNGLSKNGFSNQDLMDVKNIFERSHSNDSFDLIFGYGRLHW